MSTPDLWTEGAKALLKTLMDERDVSQIEVQEALGWGGGFISQALSGTKKLQFRVVMQIIFAMGMEPQEFFSRLSREMSLPTGGEQDPTAAAPIESRADRRVTELRRALKGLAQLLVDHHALPANEVEAALGRKLAPPGRRRRSAAES